MKKFISLSILALLSASALSAMDVSRSFFSVRPVQVPMARQNLLTDQARNQGRVLGMKNLQISLFGGASTNSDELARYFMFKGKKSLSVKGYLPASGEQNLELGQDILAENFNIEANYTGGTNTFNSTITMSPKQTFYGASLSFRMPFRNRFWFAAEAPLVHVKNDLRLTEDVTTVSRAAATGVAGVQGDLTVNNMTEGFKAASMTYGRIDSAHDDMKATRIADLTLKVGYEPAMFNRNDMYMSPYLGVILPTGNKAQAKHVFEAIAGNGGHFGLMSGTHGEFALCNMKSGKLWASYRIESQYLFQNTQKRTFDLINNGPWSRYLLMYDDETQRVVNSAASVNYGTNIMTQDVNVTPGYFGNIDMSLNYVCDKWNAALGYTVHARQGEEVKLKNGWAGTAQIASISNDVNVNPFRTIGTHLVDQDHGTLVLPIKEADIDLNSASHPGGVSCTIYASVGAMCPKHETRIFELGGSYEFSQGNASMDRVCGWIKAQLSF